MWNALSSEAENVTVFSHALLMTSIVPALRAGIIHNEKQWELYHLYQ